MKIIVCLAEKNQIKIVRDCLYELAKKHQINITIQNTEKLEALLWEMDEDPNLFDLVIMDSKFYDTDGIEQAENLRAKGYQNEIVFVSKEGNKVFDSFNAEPLFYILPGDMFKSRLEKAFLNANARMKRKRNLMVSLSFGGETRNIDLNDILYFESEGKLLHVYYEPNKEFKFYTPISKMEQMLANQGFIRIFRSIIVNAVKIESFVRNEVTLITGEKLPVGRAYNKECKKYLEEVIKV